MIKHQFDSLGLVERVRDPADSIIGARATLSGIDMALAWFDAGEAKKFGASLAQFFLERIPKASQRGDKEVAKKVDYVLEKMVVQIVQFKAQHKLNTYKKAQLGNVFKWTLLDAGIAADYADEMTSWVIQKIG